MDAGVEGAVGMITVCFHGAESTGKSRLAALLCKEDGWTCVPEYGRLYAEGLHAGVEGEPISFTMADLLAIAEGHESARQRAAAANPPVLLVDTDPLMTAAWAEMLFGEVPDELMTYPKADHYLLFEPDVPWVDDGTRFFGTPAERARFAALAEEMLQRAAVPFTRIGGNWDERAAAARAAIAGLRQPGLS